MKVLFGDISFIQEHNFIQDLRTKSELEIKGNIAKRMQDPIF